MTPVMQTKFGAGGNCFAACIVSVLDIPDALDEVTKALAGDGDWTDQHIFAANWCRTKGFTCIPFLPWDESCDEFIKGCICIAGGVAARGRRHAVVWKDGLIHDPHPDGTGLNKRPDNFTLITQLVPKVC